MSQTKAVVKSGTHLRATRHVDLPLRQRAHHLLHRLHQLLIPAEQGFGLLLLQQLLQVLLPRLLCTTQKAGRAGGVVVTVAAGGGGAPRCPLLALSVN